MATWVLLRGLGRDARHWGPFANEFQQRIGKDKLLMLDTLGNGRYADQQSPINISQYTEHCRQQFSEKYPLDKLNAKRSINLVALSLGGMIALDWAQRYPEEVKSLTVINSSVANLTPWYNRLKLMSLFKLVKFFFFSSNPKHIEGMILRLTSNQVQPHPMLAQWTDYRVESTTTLVNLLRQLYAAARFRLETPLSISPLIICSRNDNLVAYRASKDLYNTIGGHMIIHPWAGHDIPLDDPIWLSKNIFQRYEKSGTA